ncbi:kelch-like protein [Myxococcus sp. K15C18031901]|uniref:kelch repeat-containing protein n=1 Tax=Myxococcus dinghuensis TaxID=2906761 RepID=UPI0020A7E833|nr:kelch repeat-containing protein [Myxococcus dinghuensis]MCP3098518.1 kelch-like protein [Myxococcus dinghuensis]
MRTLLLLGANGVVLGACVDFDEDQKTFCKTHPEVCAPAFEETPASVFYVEKEGSLSLHAVAKDPAGDALRFSWTSNLGTFGAPRDTATSTEITWSAPDCVPPAGVSFSLTASSTREASAVVTFAAIGIPECPTVERRGDVSLARSGPAATALYSGWVLVTGGEVSGSAVDTAEVYSPRELTWSTIVKMPVARVEHVPVRLDSGQVLMTGGRNAGGAIKTADLFSPDPDRWSSTASASVGRYGHAAVLLDDGRVFVTGGFDGKALVTTSELYTPAHDDQPAVWATTRNAPVARNHCVATLLDSGRVLVTGGITDGAAYPGSADIYDPETGTWSQLDVLGAGRIHHTATLLPSGEVLVTGGSNGSGVLGSSVLVDEENHRVEAAVALTTPREHHTATLLPDGRVLVAGGRDAQGTALASTELFDPERGTWAPGPALRVARHHHAAVLMTSGKVLLVGGDGASGTLASSEVFEPGTRTWTPMPRLLTSRERLVSTRLESGLVLVMGGRSDNPSPRTYLSDVEWYDPSTGQWKGRAPMKSARGDHTATLLLSGEVLVAGGYNGSFVSGTEVFDPVANLWAEKKVLADGRAFHTATRLASGKVLVVGGLGKDGALAKAELYDPSSGAWSSAGNLAVARLDHTATLLPSGQVLVTGGYTTATLRQGEWVQDAPCRTAELYTPDKGENGTWSTLPSMTYNRGSHTATLLPSGKVLIVGGFSSAHSVMDGTTVPFAELYDPVGNGWAPAGELEESRGGHSATLLPSGKVLVVGGFGGFEDRFYLGHCELYDPGSNQWDLTSNMLTPREDPAVTLLTSGKVLVVGGRGYDGVQGDSELYLP